jgi:hypothetical protein
MNDLETYFHNNPGHLINKWKHYFEVYERHFSRFRGTDVCLVEFGVFQGGSLQMWKKYFGPNARIYGVDINPHCKKLEEDQIQILIGDQEDREFLRSLRSKIPRMDILIDDGGHTMKQQITTYEELFPHVEKNGVYLCEDLHTSYWPHFGGGYRKRSTYIEYSKNFIDGINAWHSVEKGRFDVTDFTRSAHSLHYYDGMLVVEKRPIQKPQAIKTGTPSVPSYDPPRTLWQRVRGRMSREFNKLTGRQRVGDAG